MPPAWAIAVLISSSGSFFTVLGFVLQTQAVRNDEDRKKYYQIGELVISPRWLMGALLQVIPNFFGDVIAYSIAPLSLTAPLSGVSVVVNMSLAPRLLGEVWCRWPDLPATGLILAGVITTTLTGAHHDTVRTHGLAEVGTLASAPLTVMVFVALAASLVMAFVRELFLRSHIEKESSTNFDAPNLVYLLLTAWCAAGIGAVTNIALKVFGELLSSQVSPVLTVGSLLFGVLPPALCQQQAMNRGLRLYPQSVFFPVYSSLLVLTNTFFGAVFFEEYVSMVNSGGYVQFLLGISLVMLGIAMFSLRRPEALVPEVEDGLKEKLLLVSDA